MSCIKRILPLVTFVVIFLLASPAAAQDEPKLSLRLSRDFGYSSGTGRIQGSFSMHVSGPENLTRVLFYIDQQSIGESTQSPFRLRFNTSSYSQGVHTLYAVGFTADGRELRSNEIRAEFVSAERGWQEAMRIVGPLLIVVFGILILSFVFSFVNVGKLRSLPPGTARNYGMAGGTICSKCGRPFTLFFFSPNLLVGKLARCPFCGKVGIMRSRPLADLRAAEAAELEAARLGGQVPELSEEEKLSKELDESRFQDL